jgi:sensor histidine kinase regulating citrate/malate metabolism
MVVRRLNKNSFLNLKASKTMKSLRHLSLQSKMIISIMALVLFQLGSMAIVSTYLVDTILEDQLGKRVLSVSQTIASMPEVTRLLENQDPDGKLQVMAEEIRLKIGAQFVVIGDLQQKRYSHPDPGKIGKTMVGGDNTRALKEGMTYTSLAVGTLGLSLRGKAPIIDANKKIIGIVSVGYLEESIHQMIVGKRAIIIAANGILVIIGVLVAVLLARSFKRSIFGLEPYQIGRMFKERSAILGSVREGIVAVNKDGNITMINQAAKKTLGLNSDHDYFHEPIESVLPGNGIMNVLHSGVSQLDTEHRIADKEIIVNRIPIWHDDKVMGVVSSFREKDEIHTLAKELSQVQSYSEMLRHQTHEYSNKLHTISGLIQLEAYDKAIELISSETSGYQDLLQFLASAVPDALVAGCILGKYSRAKELNIELNVDRDSNFTDVPEWVNKEKLVTVLGNLLENAYQAVTPLSEGQRVVNLSLTDLGNDLIFEVEDSGNGISEDIAEHIYERGVSSSNEKGKGIGLYLVKDILSYINGQITVNKSELGGVLFTVYISKRHEVYG